MFVRFSLAGVLLAVTLIAISGILGNSSASENTFPATDETTLRVANPVIEHGNIRVRLLELTRASSPNHDHTVTSVLFMVEHLGDSDIDSHASRSPLNFSNADGETLALPVGDCPKSGTATHDFERFNPPWHIEMPKPENVAQALIVRQWICQDIPDNAAAINAAFGRNNELSDFRFVLNRR